MVLDSYSWESVEFPCPSQQFVQESFNYLSRGYKFGRKFGSKGTPVVYSSEFKEFFFGPSSISDNSDNSDSPIAGSACSWSELDCTA